MKYRVFIYVQHLLGIGHLKRTATLARAMAANGLDVTLVSGGTEVLGLDTSTLRFLQLPPTRTTDPLFKELIDANDILIDETWKAERRNILIENFEQTKPHVLVIELFPFGRRQMQFELLPLLEIAKNRADRPVIVSSVRDILAQHHKPQRHQEMLDKIDCYFDYVLVHADPTFINLAMTFPLAKQIENKTVYTGYVVDRIRNTVTNYGQGSNEVVVSAGGGAVGKKLLITALQARHLSVAKDAVWRVLVGLNQTKESCAMINALALELGPRVIVEMDRPDFATLLANADLSISQGGYNTVMEILEAGVRSVVVPYAGGNETEQTLRAQELSRATSLEVLSEAALSPQSLANSIDRALNGPTPNNRALNTDGANSTAAVVTNWARAVAQ